MDPRALLHARLIRDADKLDNCRVKLEDQMEVLLGCSKEEAGCQEISPETWRECENRKSIHSANRRTRMDYWVSYVAYFFDINFSATCRIILEKTVCGADHPANPLRQQRDRAENEKAGGDGDGVAGGEGGG